MQSGPHYKSELPIRDEIQQTYAAAINAIWRLTNQVTTLTRSWYESYVPTLLSPGRYVEIVGMVAQITLVDRFADAPNVRKDLSLVAGGALAVDFGQNQGSLLCDSVAGKDPATMANMRDSAPKIEDSIGTSKFLSREDTAG